MSALAQTERMFGALRLTHFHVKVANLPLAIGWFERHCGVRPSFQKTDLAYFTLGAVVLVLEPGEVDTKTTIAFTSDDCDADFAALRDRGVIAISPPASHPWGIRGAYLRGPAGITLELEQRIPTFVPSVASAGPA
jgi:catechol 2,3-dioxygenase-like lactoylglutathione lyase family enzyme